MVNRLFLLNGHPLRFHEATFYQSLTLFSRKRDQTTQKVMTTPLEKLLGLSIYYNRTRSIVLHLCLSIAPTVFSSIIRKCTCHFLVQITKRLFPVYICKEVFYYLCGFVFFPTPKPPYHSSYALICNRALFRLGVTC